MPIKDNSENAKLYCNGVVVLDEIKDVELTPEFINGKSVDNFQCWDENTFCVSISVRSNNWRKMHGMCLDRGKVCRSAKRSFKMLEKLAGETK